MIELRSFTCGVLVSSSQVSGGTLQDYWREDFSPSFEKGAVNRESCPTSHPNVHFLPCMGRPEEIARALGLLLIVISHFTRVASLVIYRQRLPTLSHLVFKFNVGSKTILIPVL